jgi:hypothetical protein
MPAAGEKRPPMDSLVPPMDDFGYAKARHLIRTFQETTP